MDMLNLSILITCFNKEEWLDDCVQSILRQTKHPKEIVIVHDGCENPMAHAAADTIILNTNRGVSAARHEAVRFSTGELILFVDADDVLSPDYLEKMTIVIAGGADIAYPDIYHWAQEMTRLVTIPEITTEFVRNYKKVVIPVTCMIRRKMYDKLGGFHDFLVLEDLDFWLRAMAAGYTFKKAQTLLWYRRTPQSKNSMSILKKKQVYFQILNQFVFEKDRIYAKNKL